MDKNNVVVVNKGFLFWQRWLVGVGILVALFGLFMALLLALAGLPLFMTRKM